MAKVTSEDIIKMNNLYLEKHTYAAVARETGFAPSTVKKYIQTNWKNPLTIKKKVFRKEDLPDFDPTLLIKVEDWGSVCSLSNEEKEEIEELWEEMTL